MMNLLIPTDFTLAAFTAFGAMSLIRLLFVFGFAFSLYNASVGTRWEAPLKIIVVPLFVMGYIYDVFLNYVVATPLFLERPQYWRETISARMRRYLADGDDTDWRAKISRVFCAILNKFDQDHCQSGRRDKTAALKRYVGL